MKTNNCKENFGANELRRFINMLLEKITDERLLRRIYSLVDKLYCEQ